MKIKCAAIRTKSGQIFEGGSHADCYLAMNSADVFSKYRCEQGFVTDVGEFVDRYEAAEIAHKAGQTKKLESPLFSEDLTGDWPWAKENNGKNAKKT